MKKQECLFDECNQCFQFILPVRIVFSRFIKLGVSGSY